MVRKSPKESATLFKLNTKKKGLDGNMWIIIKTKTGVKRWKKVSTNKKSSIDVKNHKGQKSYFIHDNGGKPFLVYVGKSVVTIYKIPEKEINYNKNITKKDYTKLVRKISNISKIFIGKSPKNRMTIFSHGYGKQFDGNSILLKLKNGKYVYIGMYIYEFKLAKNDEILKYYSPVGNNDVPYPVAIGKKNVYLLIEDVYIPLDRFGDDSDLIDAYHYFYGHSGNKPLKGIKIKGKKMLQKRLL